MGLTIHWKLKSQKRNAEKIKEQIETLRQKALDMPFKEVSDLLVFKGDEANYANDKNESNRWFKIQSGEYVDIDNKSSRSVAPLYTIGFETWPGEGCESANFGMCRFPQIIENRGKNIKTKLNGWSWSSFCKTQYASNPECGGVENFLRCHLCVIKLLDCAKELNILQDVYDEDGYWEKRDIEALAKEVGEWNSMIAAFASKLEAIVKGVDPELNVKSAITEFPNFEHLEMEGLAEKE